MKKQMHVAAGIIRNATKEIFITQRRPDTFLAGFWEFPGGKLEVGESAQEALARELHEEVGIEVMQSVPFDNVSVEFDDRVVHLHFFLVEDYQGEPFGREGQHSAWVAQQDLIAERFPEANAAIVQTLLAEVAVF
ncbi:8-oxo-dGTP diphosphatase MutT [Plesiomonas sp.]|uniref:8-oxo-dGTP diphosphatase MutT n=1 Tax=Plesiomonas sp. TaxID=2486279 RepID=UPI003F3FA1BA